MNSIPWEDLASHLEPFFSLSPTGRPDSASNPIHTRCWCTLRVPLQASRHPLADEVVGTRRTQCTFATCHFCGRRPARPCGINLALRMVAGETGCPYLLLPARSFRGEEGHGRPSSGRDLPDFRRFNSVPLMLIATAQIYALGSRTWFFSISALPLSNRRPRNIARRTERTGSPTRCAE